MRLSPYVLCLLTPRTQVQIVVDVTVHAPMRLEQYPYDRHVVPFCLGTRATRDADGTLHKWELSKKWPEWAPARWTEDKVMLLEDQTSSTITSSASPTSAERSRSCACSLSARPRTS